MKKVISIIVLVAAIVGLTYVVKSHNVPNTPERAVIKTNSKIKDQVILLQDYVRYPGQDGKTAFDRLMDVTRGKVEFKRYDFGVFVESIDNVKPSEKQFWKLYVNGEEAQVGADQIQTKRGDIIEWILENIKASGETASSTSK